MRYYEYYPYIPVPPLEYNKIMAKEMTYLEKMDSGLLDIPMESGNDFQQEQYRRTFSEGMGREVLAHILAELGLFATLDGSAEATARHNTAVELLRNIGVLKTTAGGFMDPFRMKQITEALLALAVPMDQVQMQMKEKHNG